MFGREIINESNANQIALTSEKWCDMDHINSCCNVVHIKESCAEVVRIIQSEPPFTLQKVPSFVCFNQNRMFPDYIIRNSCVIRIIKSGLHQNLLVSGLHHTEHICQLFWSWVKSRKHVFTRFLTALSVDTLHAIIPSL